MITFVLPTEKNEADVTAFYKEFERTGTTCIGYNGHENYAAWLLGMQNRKTGKNLPAHFVRENFYLCYDGDDMVGVFSLKFELTPFLYNYGGHIGYAVKPSRRRRGFATEILKQGLKTAKAFGFDRMLLICDEDNVASEKTILKCGGKFENTLFDEDEQVNVKRFWIEL